MNKHAADQTSSETETLETLVQLASLANGLAKQLEGTRYQARAYQIKAVALSSLVVNGAATPNGFGLDNTVGLNFFGHRLHCPLYALTPEARRIVQRKRGSVPSVNALSECLKPEQLQTLANFPVKQRRAV